MDYIVAPLWYGACKKGPDLGALRIANLFEEEGMSTYSRIVVSDEVQEYDTLMPYFDIIDKVNHVICDSVLTSLKLGRKVITIGGDHAVSWGSIAGVLNYNPNIGVIYLDAHGDCNVAEYSNTHHIHGMHMAYLMGFGEREYVKRYTGNVLSVNNILYVGARSLDIYEINLMHKYNVSSIPSDFINLNLVRTLEIINEFMLRFNQIHISLDIDILDPSIAPGTGVPELNGISEATLHEILNLILNEDKVKSMDIVEYNPLYDIDNKTDRVIQRLVKRLNHF